MIDIPFSPKQMIFGFGAFIAILVFVLFLSAYRKYKAPYEQIESVLTPAERYFYTVLSSVVQGKAVIMAKVRLADILRVKPTIPRHNFWLYFSKISQKHIDFILVDPKSFKTLCVIELDDKSHLQFDRIKRDRFVNYIMRQAGIPLHRFSVKRRYDRTILYGELQAYFLSNHR